MEGMPLNREEERQRDLDRTKLKMDLVKHVSTLSSGAIVILAGLHPSSNGRSWLAWSIGSLITCLISSLTYFWVFGLARQFVRPKPLIWARPIELALSILVVLAFSVGILFLGVSVIDK